MFRAWLRLVSALYCFSVLCYSGAAFVTTPAPGLPRLGGHGGLHASGFRAPLQGAAIVTGTPRWHSESALCGLHHRTPRSVLYVPSSPSTSSSSMSMSMSMSMSLSVPKHVSRVLKKSQRLLTAPLRSTARGAQQLSGFCQRQLIPMLQYLWSPHEKSPRLKVFLLLSIVFMFLGKFIGVQVPFLLQKAIDNVSKSPIISATTAAAAVPHGNFLKDLWSLGETPALYQGLGLGFVVYGVSKALSVVCAEIKTCLFSHVCQSVLRKYANEIFAKMHVLPSAFHMENPSGVISVAYVRAIRGFQTMLFQLVFYIIPTLIELYLVSHALFRRFGYLFTTIMLTTFACYFVYTISITQWRIALRTKLVSVDNKRNGFFIDSILNQETVKLFNNQPLEARQFDSYLAQLESLSIESTYAIALLNLGQAFLFSTGLTVSLLVGAQRVLRGQMSIGDLIAVNSMLLQLSIPFNFMGYTYQELRQSIVDMGYMRYVLNNVHPPAVPTLPPLQELDESASSLIGASSSHLSVRGAASVSFQNVSFGYTALDQNGAQRKISLEAFDEGYDDEAMSSGGASLTSENDDDDVDIEIVKPGSEQELLGTKVISQHLTDLDKQPNAVTLPTLPTVITAVDAPPLISNLSFTVQPSQNVAIVGPSGSGKSTTLRLLTRLLEISQGAIYINGIDIRSLSIEALREKIAVIPQDTSLFDNTIEYNIRYGNLNATDERLYQVIEACNLRSVIDRMPEGLQTSVGERGVRLSGGERQKVAIARALLRDPEIILCDEITSSVDAFAERDIVNCIRNVSAMSRPRKTVLTVAHRLSSIMHCDQIIVMERGKVVEVGNHPTLLAKDGGKGVYASMWAAQVGGSDSRVTKFLSGTGSASATIGGDNLLGDVNAAGLISQDVNLWDSLANEPTVPMVSQSAERADSLYQRGLEVSGGSNGSHNPPGLSKSRYQSRGDNSNHSGQPPSKQFGEDEKRQP